MLKGVNICARYHFQNQFLSMKKKKKKEKKTNDKLDIKQYEEGP
jgi:hypothetical protein